ncbi:MAG: hypothetical protein B6U76_06715 [Desulfurococcales archaeon ex4484_217_2]|nr:MAG: hypothetical protein B6U76_06715 [Desulfurococcales archaeon ex4484_217_2]
MIDNAASILWSIGSLVGSALTIFLTYKVMKYLIEYVKNTLGRKNSSMASMAIVALKITAASIITITVYYMIKTVYPDAALTLSAVITAAGFLGIVLGLAAQSSLGNVFAGLVLVFSQALRVGDIVEYEGEVAVIEDISLTHTILRLRDGRTIVIPNSNMLNSRIVSYTMPEEKVAASITVGISYESDLNDAIKAMLEAARDHPKVLKNPAPQVIITGFGDFSINLKLLAWISDPWIKPIVESDLISMIYERFKKYNVEIPYPRRVLIFKSEMEEQEQVPAQVKGEIQEKGGV